MRRTENCGRGGFTLVELIVCLVIMAVLAAVAIPTMLGYVNKAKEDALIEETHNAVLAAQTLYSQAEANGTAVASGEIEALSEVPGTVTVAETDVVQGEVRHLLYERDGRRVVYCKYPDTCGQHEQMYTLDGEIGGGGTGGETPGGGDENPTPGGTGFTVPENAPPGITTFFAEGWKRAEVDGVSFQYKIFDSDKKNYCLILSDKNLDNAAAKKAAGITGNQTQSVISTDGKLSNGDVLHAICSSAGLDKNAINSIQYSGDEVTKISYQKNQ